MISDFVIAVDSSADLAKEKDAKIASAPLKISTENKDYIDDATLDVEGMIQDLSEYKGKSHTSCPSPNDWLQAFGDSQYVFCIPITKSLSGSYNTACIAKREYEEAHPSRKVFVVDSLTTGPEIQLIAEKIKELAEKELTFEEICEKIELFQKNTALFFMLSSVKNLSNNGRISGLAAKIVGLLGIRIIGKASDKGELQIIDKKRGDKNALLCLVSNIKAFSEKIKRIIIGHALNPECASTLKGMLQEQLGVADIKICKLGGLCSYYAETGGLIIGVEK